MNKTEKNISNILDKIQDIEDSIYALTRDLELIRRILKDMESD